MVLKNVFLMITLICISGKVYAGNNLFYYPEGALKKQLKQNLEYSRKSIDICLHDFAALDIDDYLIAAKKQGARIRIVVLEHGINRGAGSLIKELLQTDFDIRFLELERENDRFQDFIILDDRVMITGVYNWMAYQDRQIDNDVLLHYDRDRIRSYKNTFYRRFAEGKTTHTLMVDKAKVKTLHTDTRKVKAAEQGEALLPIPEKSPTIPVPGETEKVFIDITFEEMNKTLGENSTLSRSERKELWKKYKGKYVHWNGEVAYKGIGIMNWNRVGVIQGDGDKAQVEVKFNWKHFDEVTNLKVGSEIRYTGKLVSRPGIGSPFRLMDGEFE